MNILKIIYPVVAELLMIKVLGAPAGAPQHIIINMNTHQYPAKYSTDYGYG